ncbi:uncharacterized protein LOC108150707 isoform X2 [Drosophila elegans]|uniref:uncharacterized protein LOC108150707 isoform X2 n=1 Tax=Drosophila elegans TaxID=30023 RepID=UPI0007E7EC43|nr:uncharacterized protein LOC108150707 isoform X2 [Drosophila elegans]XP_017134467.1 uncharacterized protein LOC108150707 isoform X2 [Drosophila elegans]
MQLNTLRLALMLLNLLRLEAQANVHNNGRQKVLSDDFGPERDKSSARTRHLPQEDLRLRHEQHRLRQQQHQMAWEQQLQLQLQQHLQEQQSQSWPVRHHQHKSQLVELAEKPIRQTAGFADDKAKILAKRRLHYNEYDNEDLELHTIETGDERSFSPRQWQQIEIAHRRMKEQHQLQLLAERQRQRQLLTTTTTKPNDAKSEDNDVSAAKTSEDNEGHDVNNIYARNHVAGKLALKKDEQLGTPEAALKARRLHAQKQKSERALAHAHMNQVLKEATCRVPQKRCQLVQQDPSKIYTPHCTILHRCSEDSGCCPSRSQICAAKSIHNVELHFFVKSSKHRSVIEKRTFVNHTECHCIERSNYNEDTAMAMAHYGQSVVRATILSCTCPKSFEKILQDDGQCRCDCSSGNYDCDWLKRGNEHFAMNDRKCIQQGRCKPPTCEFGPYMDKHGRCPKQHEQPAYNAMS